MEHLNEKQMCEKATGIPQQGEIIFYNEEGDKISLEEAKEIIRDNGLIEVPSAGSGSFREIFASLGFGEVEVYDWTSSAGDWSFGVKNEYVWFSAWQENRYPYHGFKYCISSDVMPCNTFEDLCKEIEEM